MQPLVVFHRLRLRRVARALPSLVDAWQHAARELRPRIWDGETPSDDAAAAAVYETISNELESGDPVTPSASIVAYVSALLGRWPDITTDAGDDSPWADGPMIANASGSWISFSMVWSRAEEASQYAAELAAEHGLVCFDPQSEKVRPTTATSTTRRRRWLGSHR